MGRSNVLDEFDLDVRIRTWADTERGIGYGVRAVEDKTQDTCAATCPATCPPSCNPKACAGDTADGCPAGDFMPIASHYCPPG